MSHKRAENINIEAAVTEAKRESFILLPSQYIEIPANKTAEMIDKESARRGEEKIKYIKRREKAEIYIRKEWCS